MDDGRKRYVLVGAGGRAVMFVDALVDRYKAAASLVAICDLSQTRMDWHNRRIGELYGTKPIATYHAGDFDRMIREQRPDTVIVCAIDAVHHQYIVRAMELGCDVICEKPMTIDAPKARAIFDAIERSGRKLRITFNLRYAPLVSKVRELMSQGVVGSPKAVTLNWMLDVRHGADYFHRWHREKDKSGGLLVHKATHHFDMVNWWIGSYPKTVFAIGGLMFYGRENADKRGEKYSYDRYTGSADAKNDPFAIFLDRQSPANEAQPFSANELKGLYLDAEKETGYVRDRNVFGDGITIEDAMSLSVRYRSGAILNYSLVAFSPWEGYHASITGDKGRLEVSERGGVQSIRVCPMFDAEYDVTVPKGEGAHGGGDALMLDHIFAEGALDPLGRAASHIDGAASILVGISANESIRSGLAVNCDDLLKLPG